jgi:hypothetical protein
VVLHYDGISWSTIWSGSATDFPDSVWGASSTDVFVVCDGGGLILHYNGSSWSVTHEASTRLYGVWGSSNSNVFAVGEDETNAGVIWHCNGASWSPMPSGATDKPLYGVWGSSATDVFAVGYGGTILHYGD